MAKLRQIALAFPATGGYHEDILLGIEAYSRDTGSWLLSVGPDTLNMSVSDLRGWRGDGLIAEVVTLQASRTARKLNVPVVNLSGVLHDARIPRVMNDHYAIGRLGAEGLLGCEIQHFAYYGLKNVWYSQERGRGFAETLARKGFGCDVLETPGRIGKRQPWYYWLDELGRWLKRLPLPCGILAVHDPRARMVVDACRQVGLNVPHDVAVVGVGNSRFVCEISPPTISSIARNGWEIGQRAAKLLDRLMSGERPPAQDILVPPAGFVPRQSTDMVAVNDPELNRAVRFIREHLAEPMTVKTLLRAVSVSRRWLECRFRQRFGCAPYEYICYARVERAKQLLLSSERLRIGQIAGACGFVGTRNLRLVFRRFTGMTPQEYRLAHSTDRR